MANYFWRKPRIGQDENQWGQYNDAHINVGLGICTCKLYDDAGTLKISKGKIGIDDNTITGVSLIDTITTISMALVSNGNWAKIEMSVSGTAVTFAAADIVGATDESSLPAGFTGSYDGDKTGYYITGTKRCIGLAWKNSGGTLEGVVNVISNLEAYEGYSLSDDANDNWYYFDINKVEDEERVSIDRAMYLDDAGAKSIVKLKTKVIEIGDWDMNTVPLVAVAHGLPDAQKIRSISVFIRPDTGTTLYPLNSFQDGADPLLVAGGVDGVTSTNINLRRRSGGRFNDAAFDATSYNRGWVTIVYEE